MERKLGIRENTFYCFLQSLYSSFHIGVNLISFGSKKVICALAPGSKRDLISVKELIEDGKITESGTHQQLVENQGYYARIYEKQLLETEEV